MNCHGCKYLDETKSAGSGYCCMVERSEAGKWLRAYLTEHAEEYRYGRKEIPSLKVRRPDMERCELYEGATQR